MCMLVRLVSLYSLPQLTSGEEKCISRIDTDLVIMAGLEIANTLVRLLEKSMLRTFAYQKPTPTLRYFVYRGPRLVWEASRQFRCRLGSPNIKIGKGSKEWRFISNQRGVANAS